MPFVTASRQPDLRNAIRFPLHLPVTLKTPNGEFEAKTSDISAGGILFHLGSDIEVGSAVEFSIEMPADVLGSDQQVMVRCKGRVVRSMKEHDGRSVAVVIDEYHFERV